MEYAALGSSDLHVSRISLGCMSLPLDEKESTLLIHRAVELGINFFDTADIYNDGLNEKLLGRVLKEKRREVIIATKAGNVRRPDGGLDWNPTKKHILQSFEGSLKRLDTDYIDLYQLHGGTINDNITDTIEAFELLKQQGKIRHYGISSIRPNVITEYIKKSSITSVMMQYSLLDRRPEEYCIPLVQANQKGILARGALAQGLLVDKPAKQYLEHSPKAVGAAADAIRSVSADGRTPTHTAIKYILRHKSVSTAVVGVRTMKQLEDVASCFNSSPLTNEELEKLNDSIPALLYREHRL